MIQLGAQHFDSVRKDKAALELPCGDATVEERLVFAVIVQPAANDHLVDLDTDAEILGRKSCNRERDLEVLVVGVLDVVRRIRFRLAVSLEQPLDVFKAQKKRA